MVRTIKQNAVINGIKVILKVLFPLFTFPYVSRILQSENLGKITFSQSVVEYFVLIASLGISNYAVREGASLRFSIKKLEKFSNQIFTINVLTSTAAYLSLVTVLFFSAKLQNYTILILIHSLTIFFSTIGVEWLYTIQEAYSYMTVRTFLVQAVSLILMFLMVRTSQDYIIYVLITVLASGGTFVFGFFHARKYCRLRLVKKIEIKRHFKPMVTLLANNLAMNIYINSDITLLGLFSGDIAVGLYSVSVKIYKITKELINALIVVTLPRLSFYLGEENYDSYIKLLNKILNGLIVLTLPAFTGLAVLSQELVVLIAGENYASSFTCLIILSFAMLFAVFAAFITTSVMIPNRMENKVLKATILAAAINLCLNFILIPLYHQNGAAFTTLLAEFTVFMYTAFCVKKELKNLKWKKAFFSSLAGSACIIILVKLCKICIKEDILFMVISIAGSILLYGIIQLILKNEIIIDLFYGILNKIKK